ncbi:MAG: nucleotidyltransferase domain-containing protein [Actinomycetes bacterium]|jgi:predicted nucleotidyltransferase|nr:nucleotidyltransferase domain-containing protein [Actinomycetes bacterium]
MTYSIDDIRQRVLPIVLQDARDVRKVVLFGSYARGEQTPTSDLDVYVDGQLMYRPDDTQGTEEKLAESLSVSVDLLTRSALATSVIRDKLTRSIERDGVVLYG